MNNFSKRHFGDIDIKELIYHYKQYECLWNFNSIDYKNKSLRQRAWQNIANYFHKNINEVKRKIKYLRTAYVAEKKKVVTSQKNGSSTPYKPSLFYFNELDFLDNVVVWRKSPDVQENNNVEFEKLEIAAEETQDFISYVEDVDADYKSPEVNCKVESYAEQLPISTSPLPNTISPKSKSSTTLSSQPPKRKRCESIKCTKPIKNNAPTASKENNNQLSDLYNSFGKTISLHLQQLPLETAVVTMSDIHTILTTKTLEYIKSTKTENGNESYSQSDSNNSFSDVVDELY